MPILPCECLGPGFCARYGRTQSERQWQLCSGRCPPELPCTQQQTEAYQELWLQEKQYGGLGQIPKAPLRRSGTPAQTVSPSVQAAPTAKLPLPLCWFLGDKTGILRPCGSCKGKVKEIEYHCKHPYHAQTPVTTLRECRQCQDHTRPPEDWQREPARAFEEETEK